MSNIDLGGLEFNISDFEWPHKVLPAAIAQQANRLLRERLMRSQEVYGWEDSTVGGQVWTYRTVANNVRFPEFAKRTGFLVGVTAIKPPDTAESLLRELIEKAYDNKINPSQMAFDACHIAVKAKTLLDNK